jgi:hypothetical protein
MTTDSYELPELPESSGCKHPRTEGKYDHVECLHCGAVYTDGQWGTASNQWFASIAIAREYAHAILRRKPAY